MSFVEGAFFAEYFGDDAFGAEDGHQVFLAKVVGLHQGAKNLDGRNMGNSMVLFFVGFDEREQDLGIFLFVGSGILFGSELFQNREVVLMLALGSDGSGGADGSSYFSGTVTIISASPYRRIPRDSESAGYRPCSTDI